MLPENSLLNVTVSKVLEVYSYIPGLMYPLAAFLLVSA